MAFVLIEFSPKIMEKSELLQLSTTKFSLDLDEIAVLFKLVGLMELLLLDFVQRKLGNTTSVTKKKKKKKNQTNKTVKK